MTDDPVRNRRPLASRQTGLARRLTAALLRTSITPDQISFAGMLFAAAAGVLLLTPSVMTFLVAALLIQLRLLANLLDGLVAVEGGRGSRLGPLWNEAPDRLEDTLILTGFGIAAGAPILGLFAALGAMFCAYVRVLGGALGQAQTFAGPMAKQHRMAAITLGCLLGATELVAGRAPVTPQIILWIVSLGALLTAARRLAIIARGLE
jgi:phosphatidylglycerophosphate synthase